MEMAEAIADAMEQFEKQGINLHNIVISEKGSQAVVESVQAQLKDLPHDELVGHLNTMKKYCKTDLAQRVLVTDYGAYSVLVKLTQSSEKVNVLKTLIVVMDTNPDHLETQEINLLNSLLLEHGVGEVLLFWILSSFAGVRCEANRVQFVTSGILDKLEMVIKVGEREDVIRVCRI